MNDNSKETGRAETRVLENIIPIDEILKNWKHVEIDDDYKPFDFDDCISDDEDINFNTEMRRYSSFDSRFDDEYAEYAKHRYDYDDYGPSRGEIADLMGGDYDSSNEDFSEGFQVGFPNEIENFNFMRWPYN